MYHRDERGAPNRQAKPDSDNGDDEGAHVAALALAEVYQRGGLWQNRLNYPGSSAQAITIKATLA